jgi:hypothetical protein
MGLSSSFRCRKLPNPAQQSEGFFGGATEEFGFSTVQRWHDSFAATPIRNSGSSPFHRLETGKS